MCNLIEWKLLTKMIKGYIFFTYKFLRQLTTKNYREKEHTGMRRIENQKTLVFTFLSSQIKAHV